MPLEAPFNYLELPRASPAVVLDYQAIYWSPQVSKWLTEASGSCSQQRSQLTAIS